MAVFFGRVPRSMLGREFIYRGWFCGLVPVYVGPLRGVEGPAVAVRNGVPEWTLDAVHVLHNAFAWTVAALGLGDVAGVWPIKITGRLDGAPLEDDL